MLSTSYSLSLSSVQTSFCLIQWLTVSSIITVFPQTRHGPTFSGPKLEMPGKGWCWPRLGVGGLRKRLLPLGWSEKEHVQVQDDAALPERDK